MGPPPVLDRLIQSDDSVTISQDELATLATEVYTLETDAEPTTAEADAGSTSNTSGRSRRPFAAPVEPGFASLIQSLTRRGRVHPQQVAVFTDWNRRFVTAKLNWQLFFEDRSVLAALARKEPGAIDRQATSIGPSIHLFRDMTTTTERPRGLGLWCLRRYESKIGPDASLLSCRIVNDDVVMEFLSRYGFERYVPNNYGFERYLLNNRHVKQIVRLFDEVPEAVANRSRDSLRRTGFQNRRSVSRDN